MQLCQQELWTSKAVAFYLVQQLDVSCDEITRDVQGSMVLYSEFVGLETRRPKKSQVVLVGFTTHKSGVSQRYEVFWTLNTVLSRTWTLMLGRWFFSLWHWLHKQIPITVTFHCYWVGGRSQHILILDLIEISNEVSTFPFVWCLEVKVQMPQKPPIVHTVQVQVAGIGCGLSL